MQPIYSLLLSLLWPIWVGVLARKAWVQPDYRAGWWERVWVSAGLGRGWSGPTLWVHAVSVGETRAAAPIVRAWLAAQPQADAARIFLTQTTPTGRATAQTLFEDLIREDRLRMAYLPIDHPWLMRRLIRSIRADLLLLMETEIWPGLLSQARALRLPVALANGRLSEKSLRGYAWLGGLARDAFASLGLVMAQTEGDAQRLDAAGVRGRVVVTGSVKFDHEPSAEQIAMGRRWRRDLAVPRVWCFASSREGEEALVLRAWVSHRPPNTLLLLVPRHPNRAAEVAELVRSMGLRLERRSQWVPAGGPSGEPAAGPAPDVWLGDSLGEMTAYLSAADLVLVGGSLLPHGGQSPIEAAALGKPLAFGPHMQNFRAIASALLEAHAAAEQPDAEAFLRWADQAQSAQGELDAAAEAQGARAAEFVLAHRGATQRCLRALREWRQPASVEAWPRSGR